MDLGKTHNRWRVIPQTMSFAQGMKICFFVFLVNCSLISNSRISAEWFVLTLAGQRLDFHCANVRGYNDDDDDDDDDEPTWPIIQIGGNPLNTLWPPWEIVGKGGGGVWC